MQSVHFALLCVKKAKQSNTKLGKQKSSLAYILKTTAAKWLHICILTPYFIMCCRIQILQESVFIHSITFWAIITTVTGLP